MSFSIENYLAVQIPSDWTHRRLKEVSDVAPSNVDKHEVEGQPRVLLCNYVDTYKNERITSTIEFMPATATHVQIDRLSLKSGDITITKDSESPWDIGVPALISENIPNLVCGYHLSKISPLEGVMTGQYLVWALRSKPVNLQFALAAQGITRFGLNSSSLADGVVPCPPLEKQLAIAGYLDTETKRIDGLIEEKLKLKELLIELRAATISEVILGGKKSKDGQLSIQWEKTRLKYFASMQSGNAITSEFIEEEGQYPVYGGNGLRGYAREYTHEGDHILIGRQGALCGNVHLVEGKFWASEHAVVVTLYKGDNSRWAQYLLGQMNLGQYSIASAQPGLAVDRIKELEVLRPPVEEQLAIAKHLDEETKRIDELVAHVDSEIELLKELRASTITDAVLGHIDVRQAAKH